MMKKNYLEPTISAAEIAIEQGIAASELQGVQVEDWTLTNGETVNF